MRQKIKEAFLEFTLLLRSVPSYVLTVFIVSVFAMNLLANKSIAIPVEWLALDCGIIVSWVSFLTMDIMTKHFGPKAATQLSLFALAINLLFCLVMFCASKIPGVWGESNVTGSETVINVALDNTFGGTWYVLLGSAVAFTVSAVVNNFSNYGIGKLCKTDPDRLTAYVLRSYVSTAIGQFIDNLIFSFMVSHVFFGWSPLQCVMCALSGMVVELLCEVVFSYPGYLICKKWKRDNVGESYFAYRKNREGVTAV